MKKRILFRCEGGDIPEIGLGHVIRCSLLAKELLKESGTDILFLIHGETEGFRRLQSEGLRVSAIETGVDETIATLRTLATFKPDIVVVDLLHFQPDYLALIKKSGVILITLDHTGAGQELPDFTINPILAKGTSLYEGFHYMVLPVTSQRAPARTPTNGRPRVFVSFGGYDRNDLTRRLVNALPAGIDQPEYTVVVSDLYQNQNTLVRTEKTGPIVRVYRNPSDFADLLRRSDLAVVSGGLTMFQAVQAGVPAVVISQYAHQAENAARLQKTGAVEHLGLGEGLDFHAVQKRIHELSRDNSRRRAMTDAGRGLFDGCGVQRVAQLIGIINRLQWDSQFFKLNIASLSPNRVRESVMQFALSKCAEDRIDCLYYLCDCHDPESVRLVEKYGFHFVDIRLTYQYDLKQFDQSTGRQRDTADMTTRAAREDDLPDLCAIAGEIYLHSRYFFDQHFPADDCRRFYSDWITKSVRGTFDHHVIVAEQNGVIAGYVSCRILSETLGSIGLLGIAKSFQGQKVASLLMAQALEWFSDRGLVTVQVVTQGRNIPAQRLYQACGFRSAKTELWYHKWFEDRYAN